MVLSCCQVWDDAVAAGCEPDCRMCTSLLEVCTRSGDTARALAMYDRMRDAAPGSRLAPSVHAFTAAMRAAADGGRWEKALCIWSDMVAAGCQPTGQTLFFLLLSVDILPGNCNKSLGLLTRISRACAYLGHMEALILGKPFGLTCGVPLARMMRQQASG